MNCEQGTQGKTITVIIKDAHIPSTCDINVGVEIRNEIGIILIEHYLWFESQTNQPTFHTFPILTPPLNSMNSCFSCYPDTSQGKF